MTENVGANDCAHAILLVRHLLEAKTLVDGDRRESAPRRDKQSSHTVGATRFQRNPCRDFAFRHKDASAPRAMLCKDRI
jgi:hypothetical protein